ncbi:MAG: creatininase family protein [Acidobacteriaceae bacterium]
MFLERMKWPEVDALCRSDIAVVCCLSALEQHSWHLPMGTDYLIGGEIVRRLERSAPEKLLCLPAIWLGCSSHHLTFAGTMSATLSTMSSVIRDITFSVHRHGFRKLLFINSHGGNRAALSASVQELGHEFPNMQIVGATYWQVAKQEIAAIRGSEFGGMGHACELETSVVLAVAGELVDMSRAEKDGILAESTYSRSEMLAGSLVDVYKSMNEMSHHGGFGDPCLATAQKGERFLDAIVGGLSALCADILAERI